VIAKVAAMSPAVTVVRHTSPPVVEPAAPSAEKQNRPAKVEVKKGESLSDIAKRWGTSVPAIMMENNLVSPNVKPGTKLKLPKP
jgi:LysM repeat protein